MSLDPSLTPEYPQLAPRDQLRVMQSYRARQLMAAIVISEPVLMAEVYYLRPTDFPPIYALPWQVLLDWSQAGQPFDDARHGLVEGASVDRIDATGAEGVDELL